MNRCPITYEPCGEKRYSEKGLHLLSKKIDHLEDFPYSQKEQIDLALKFAIKISIQGVQPKLSVKLNVAKSCFEIVEKGGTFILKPPHQLYEELPQNEDLTMKLAESVFLEVPSHGLVFNKDSSLTYFIKRFDRTSRHKKLAVEDFSQLMGYTRETKYDSSMEKLITVIEKHCTFPLLEKVKLFRLTLFSFLIGNEDMHLKNFSLIRREGKVELSPVYDLLNSSIVLDSREELALPLRGKKSKLKKEDLIDYFGKEKLGLVAPLIEEELNRFFHVQAKWKALINLSFLSDKMKEKYLELLTKRLNRLFLI